ncbi:MAG: ABC transporter substrate-binding protein [Thermomicrobiales bacterium]
MTDQDVLRRAVSRRRLVHIAGIGAGAATLPGILGASRIFAAPLRQDDGGDLIIGTDADTYRTEPDRSNIGQYPTNTNIFESLVRLTPDYQVEPLLAESWEFVEPNTWRFTLRQGVTFHDGTPFTAEAVVWSMARIARRGGGVLGIDENSTVAVDDFTVEITPTRPNKRLVQQLNHPQNSIVAPNTEPAETRVGTGPYREVEYAREDRYTVEAYDGYWGEAPAVGRLTFRFYPDAVSRALALQSGEVDIALIERQSGPEIEATDGLALVTSQVGAYEALYVNIHGAEPYDLGQDPAIREAIAYAIDKQTIVDGVWEGYAEVNNTMIPPRILGPSASIVEGTTYDPDRAKQILEAAGWTGEGTRQKDGRELQLTMVVGFPDADTHGAMPELVQAQLAEVGIALELVQTPDTPTYEARLQTLEGDLWAEAGSQNDGNPCFLPDLLFYSPPEDGDPESMMYGAAFAPGPDFDAHIDMCRDAVEIEAVQESAANAMKVLIDDMHVVIPLAGTIRLIGVSDNVQGLEAHPSGVNQRWTGVTVSE